MGCKRLVKSGAISQRVLLGIPRPITWVVGKEWVVFHGADRWTIRPDEPVTKEQVRDLLVSSAGIYEFQDY